MSSVSPALPGRPTFGGLLTRIFIIGLIWAGLVAGLLHYLGHVWPVAYQISQAEAAEADRNAHAAMNPPAAPPSATSGDAASMAAPAPASASAAALADTTALVTPVPAAIAASPPTPAAAAKLSAAPADASTAGAAATAPAATVASPPTPAASAKLSAAPAVASMAGSAATAPAASSAAPAAPATSASVAAPAPKAASGEKQLPYDSRLAGFNRTALTNVAIFYAIVTSVLCVGAIILQIFKYCHREEEAAH